MTTDNLISGFRASAPAVGTLTSTMQAASSVPVSQARSTQRTIALPTHTAAPTDSVKLWLESQIKLLKQQGQDAKQIAASVGTTEKEVEEELGETELITLTK